MQILGSVPEYKPPDFFPTGEANIKVSRIKNWKDCDEDGQKLWTGVLLPVTGHPETTHSFPSRFVLGRLVGGKWIL